MLAYIIISAALILGLFSILLVLYLKKPKDESAPEIARLNALLEERSRNLETLFAEKQRLEKERNSALESRVEIETRLAAEKEKNQQYQEMKQELLKGNRESILEANKSMLEEHKKQGEAARKESEERIKLATEKLADQFGEVFKNINILNEKVETVDIIRRSLLTPGGAGAIAELTLENIFKVSNLQAEMDYVLQYVTKDSDRQRPDAIVFLPNDDILIIDSKSSKIFLELEEEQNEEKDLLAKLKATMSRHLKSLAERDYQENIRKSLEKTHSRKVNNIFTAMFLPSDSAWEKAKKADPAFLENAFQKSIFPCGPTGLVSILAGSRFSIMRDKHNRNYDKIIEEVRGLLGIMADLFESARKVGSGLDQASRNYNDFINRFNSKFLDKAREIGGMGLGLPAKFPSNNIEFLETKVKIIEGEVQEIKVLKP